MGTSIHIWMPAGLLPKFVTWVSAPITKAKSEKLVTNLVVNILKNCQSLWVQDCCYECIFQCPGWRKGQYISSRTIRKHDKMPTHHSIGLLFGHEYRIRIIPTLSFEAQSETFVHQSHNNQNPALSFALTICWCLLSAGSISAKRETCATSFLGNSGSDCRGLPVLASSVTATSRPPSVLLAWFVGCYSFN